MYDTTILYSYTDVISRVFMHVWSFGTLTAKAFHVLWQDGAGYITAMRLYEIARQQRRLYDWCRYVWRAKKAWVLYLREQTFPLPIAPLVE